MELSDLGLQYLQPSAISCSVGVDRWLPSSVWNTSKMKQFNDWAVRTVASVCLNILPLFLAYFEKKIAVMLWFYQETHKAKD